MDTPLATAFKDLAEHVFIALNQGRNPDLKRAFDTALDIRRQQTDSPDFYISPDVVQLVDTVDSLQDGERVAAGQYARPRFNFISAHGDVYELIGDCYRHAPGFIQDTLATLDDVRQHSANLHSNH